MVTHSTNTSRGAERKSRKTIAMLLFCGYIVIIAPARSFRGYGGIETPMLLVLLTSKEHRPLTPKEHISLLAKRRRILTAKSERGFLLIRGNPLASCFCSGGAACEEPLLQSGGYAHALRRTRRRPLPEFLPCRPQDRSAGGEPFPLSA